MSRTAAILDVDGTLVDSNYQHAIAWYRAFRENGVTLPVWRIHRAIGMGGDKLVSALAGEEVEREAGDAIREAESARYGELIGEVAPLEGAAELIDELARRDHEIVLASSAPADEVAHYVELLDGENRIRCSTSADDVSETKPEPDLVGAAMRKAGALSAVMVGDSPWDVEAARRADIETVAVLTGGYSERELLGAGAVCVFDSLVELHHSLEATPLRGSP